MIQITQVEITTRIPGLTDQPRSCAKFPGQSYSRTKYHNPPPHPHFPDLDTLRRAAACMQVQAAALHFRSD